MDNNRLSGYFLSRLSEKEIEDLYEKTPKIKGIKKEQALEQMDTGIYDKYGNLVGEIDVDRYRTLEERDRFRIRYLQRLGYKVPEDLKERMLGYDK